jgi:CIC family chloride channel protein
VRPRFPNLSDVTAFARLLEFRTVSRWVGLGFLVGVTSGLAAVLFFVGLGLVRFLVLDTAVGLPPVEPAGEYPLFSSVGPTDVRLWALPLAPALGGLISGFLVWRFCPEAEGGGNDVVIDTFHRRAGRMRKRVSLVKGIAAVLLVGSGGSAGREGPIAQVGASLGSMLGSALRLSDRERRLLLLAGAAGGIGAIFRTPLGAALFVVEVLYRDDLEVDALVPAVFSSVVAYSVFTMIFGETRMFATAGAYNFDPRQLPFYLLMAVAAALVGVLFIKVFRTTQAMFARLRMHSAMKPMLGGLGVGLLALGVPHVLGTGYGWLQEAIHPRAGALPGGYMGALALLGIALAKVFATSLSVGSGGAGGVFAPSVLIGGMVGGAFGLAAGELFPTVVTQPGAFVIVGMACFVGGVAHAPISTLVMASEMTGGYDLLVPIMLAEAVTFATMRNWTLFETQVATRRDSPAHGGEYVLDLLQEIPVRDVYAREETVIPMSPAAPIGELLRQAAGSKQGIFPLVSGSGRIEGVVTQETLRAFFYDEDIGRLAIGADCAMPIVSITPDDTLATALERFASSHYPELLVVAAEDQNRVLGVLSYEGLLAAYRAELGRRRVGIE